MKIQNLLIIFITINFKILCFSQSSLQSNKVTGLPAGATNSIVESKNPGEITFSQGLVIEGKVEKPQVQFTLLREETRIKSIKLKADFKKDILKWERENSFSFKD